MLVSADNDTKFQLLKYLRPPQKEIQKHIQYMCFA